jgi:hypothetical protein
MEKEREIRAQEGGSNGRKWLFFRAYKAIDLGRDPAGFLGREAWGFRLRLKTSLFTINESQRFGCALDILQFCCLSLLCFAT